MRPAMSDYLASLPLQHVCITEPLRLGRAQLLRRSDAGTLIYEPHARLHLLAARDLSAAQALFADVRHTDFVMLCSDSLAPLLDGFNLSHRMRCLQAVYTRPEPPALDSRLHITPPDDRQLEIMIANYHMESPEELRRRAGRGEIFFATDHQGRDVGFVGLHPEGCFGLLQVLPEMRGRGYGAALEAFIIRFCLDHNRLPYCQVDVNNQASLNLQKKLGLDLAPLPMLMAWNDF